jgi:hypothetical protein
MPNLLYVFSASVLLIAMILGVLVALTSRSMYKVTSVLVALVGLGAMLGATVMVLLQLLLRKG